MSFKPTASQRSVQGQAALPLAGLSPRDPDLGAPTQRLLPRSTGPGPWPRALSSVLPPPSPGLRGSRTQNLLYLPPASPHSSRQCASCGGWGRRIEGERGRAESAGCLPPFPGSPGGQRALCAQQDPQAAWGRGSRGRAEGDGVTLAAVTPFGEGGQWSDGKHPVLCRRAGCYLAIPGQWGRRPGHGGQRGAGGVGFPAGAAGSCSARVAPPPAGRPPAIRPPRSCGPLGPGWGAPWRPRGEGQPMWGDLAKRTGTQWEAQGRARTWGEGNPWPAKRGGHRGC